MAIRTITIHRVEVQVPWRVYELYGDSREYEIMFMDASKGSSKSGCDRYSKVVEYAEFSDLPSALAAEFKMNAAVRYFEQKQIDYDNENQ